MLSSSNHQLNVLCYVTFVTSIMLTAWSWWRIRDDIREYLESANPNRSGILDPLNPYQTETSYVCFALGLACLCTVAHRSTQAVLGRSVAVRSTVSILLGLTILLGIFGTAPAATVSIVMQPVHYFGLALVHRFAGSYRRQASMLYGFALSIALLQLSNSNRDLLSVSTSDDHWLEWWRHDGALDFLPLWVLRHLRGYRHGFSYSVMRMLALRFVSLAVDMPELPPYVEHAAYYFYPVSILRSPHIPFGMWYEQWTRNTIDAKRWDRELRGEPPRTARSGLVLALKLALIIALVEFTSAYVYQPSLVTMMAEGRHKRLLGEPDLAVWLYHSSTPLVIAYFFVGAVAGQLWALVADGIVMPYDVRTSPVMFPRHIWSISAFWSVMNASIYCFTSRYVYLPTGGGVIGIVAAYAYSALWHNGDFLSFAGLAVYTLFEKLVVARLVGRAHWGGLLSVVLWLPVTALVTYIYSMEGDVYLTSLPYIFVHALVVYAATLLLCRLFPVCQSEKNDRAKVD